MVFGPIFSRRLGASLGVNLLPEKGKWCNFDCIYCECGWNRDGRGDARLPEPEEFRAALTEKLEDCAAKGVRIDSITFSGSGEPTLHPRFPEMVDLCLGLRDRYYPGTQVSVLTNATRLGCPAVFEALRRVDNPILKIDAPTEALAAKINRPAGPYHIREVVERIKGFRGDFILQTMFLRSPDFDSGSPEVLEGWMALVRELRPRLVMVYTLDRPAPQEGLEKYSVAEMQALVRPLLDEGFRIQFR